MSEFQSPTKLAEARQFSNTLDSPSKTLNPPPFQLKTDEKESQGLDSEQKDSSPRMQGDTSMAKIFAGMGTIKHGDKGINVVKVQQALVDMKYKLPMSGVNGDFGDETATALKQFQKDARIKQTKEFDKATAIAMDKRFDTRADYLEAAKDVDPANPYKKARILSADQKDAAKEALKPQPAKLGAKFDPKDSAAYASEISSHMSLIIPILHKNFFASKKDLRKDPRKNFHKDSNLEGAANAGKDVTDNVYGALAKGPAFKMNINLIDQWKDEETRNGLLSETEKKDKAITKVKYLIASQCGAINAKFNADPGGAIEAKLLEPIVNNIVSTPEKVQTILDIEAGWPGAQADGMQYLQMFKDSDNEVNRVALWKLFHISIHEYLHSLAHSNFDNWARSLSGSQSHTLIEGYCDFFTLNVRAKYPDSALKKIQANVEGDFHDPAKKVPTAKEASVGVYASNQEAERHAAIVGINNAQLGYFRGRTDLMGN